MLIGDFMDEDGFEIEITRLAANRIADHNRRGFQWRKFYNFNMPTCLPENRGPDRLFTVA